LKSLDLHNSFDGANCVLGYLNTESGNACTRAATVHCTLYARAVWRKEAVVRVQKPLVGHRLGPCVVKPWRRPVCVHTYTCKVKGSSHTRTCEKARQYCSGRHTQPYRYARTQRLSSSCPGSTGCRPRTGPSARTYCNTATGAKHNIKYRPRLCFLFYGLWSTCSSTLFRPTICSSIFFSKQQTAWCKTTLLLRSS